MKSINPANGRIIEEYAEHTPAQCDAIIDKVYDAWNRWKHSSFAVRSGVMNKVAALLLARKHELALLITREMGKIIGEAEAELAKSALVCQSQVDLRFDYDEESKGKHPFWIDTLKPIQIATFDIDEYCQLNKQDA